MNIAICDDNLQDTAKIVAILKEYFQNNCYIGDIFTYESGEALCEAFQTKLFSVVFLDIYLNGISGLLTAKRLRELDPNFALIFISESVDHAMESFSYRPSYYIHKPIKQIDINNAFIQIQNVLIKNAKFIEILSERKKIKIPLIKIIYIETYGRIIIFHTTNGDIKSTAPMLLDDLEKLLGNTFLRCHRSYIINMSHVNIQLPDAFRMNNTDIVPMRQRKRNEIKNSYADFITSMLYEGKIL